MKALRIVPILLLAYLFLGLYYNFSIWYKLTDQTRFGSYIAIGGSIITIGLNVSLVPNPALPCYVGPAWAALACYLFMAVAAYWLGRKKYPIPYPIGRMLFSLLLAIAFFGLSYAIKEHTNWSTIATIVCEFGMVIAIYNSLYYRFEQPFSFKGSLQMKYSRKFLVLRLKLIDVMIVHYF